LKRRDERLAVEEQTQCRGCPACITRILLGKAVRDANTAIVTVTTIPAAAPPTAYKWEGNPVPA